MIPIKLSISGFLSYRDPVEIDFGGIHLACIAGQNGAGKSSILDAITWALFGKARKDDESIINSNADLAEVILTFSYEGNTYRVQRTNPRGKAKTLEYYIKSANNGWKPLTERRLRDTQERIEKTISMDYDTFVNASFFLQGKADEFTKQTPAKRKEILSNILGLEKWDTFKQRATEKRKEIEAQIARIDGQIQGINDELSEEEVRAKRLEEIQKELGRLTKLRVMQEKSLESIKQTMATLDGQRQLAETLRSQLESKEQALENKRTSLQDRSDEKSAYQSLLKRAAEIEDNFKSLRTARLELERLNDIAKQFHDQEKKRQEPLREIAAERARLQQELNSLLEHRKELEAATAERPHLIGEIQKAEQQIQEAQSKLEQRDKLKAELDLVRQQKADAEAENPRLKEEMNDLKARIDALTKSEAVCPTCGKPLLEDQKQELLQDLQTQGKTMGDKYRNNITLLKEVTHHQKRLIEEINLLTKAEEELRNLNRILDQLKNKQSEIDNKQKDWETKNAPRLAKIEQSLEQEDYASEARERLRKIDAELKTIGYDVEPHDALRKQVSEGLQIEEEYHALERATAATEPLERSINDLKEEIATLQNEIAALQKQHDEAITILAAAEAEMPDLKQAQQELLNIQEDENNARMRMGMAQQMVEAIKTQKENLKKINRAREELAILQSQYKQLEIAFGKNGVPALLIEQALPQIENKANEILQRLSGGNMNIRFITQRKLKDKKRQDLKDTLDIQISDSSGIRGYEMYSGGESFRVNFAIRIALSEVLAQRAGGRLQTLVIDEGFGTQDDVGRQRLVEAINMIADDFKKILVITHVEELKDAFSTRIQVEKTPRGSQITIY